MGRAELAGIAWAGALDAEAPKGRTVTATPPPDWYPDPASPAMLRYWDGVSWTDHLRPAAPPGPAIPSGFRGLSTWLVALLGVQAAMLLVDCGVQVWGARLLAGYAADPMTISVPLAQALDVATVSLSVVRLLFLVGCGVVWAVWEYRIASLVPAPVRGRTPAMHVASWVIPVVSWWFPYQNLAALRRALPPDPRGALPLAVMRWWWLAWVLRQPLGAAANAMMRTSEASEPVTTLEYLGYAAQFDAVAAACGVLAAVLAILIVRSLTRQALELNRVTFPQSG